MADQQAQTANIRTNFYDKAIKQIAERQYKFKQAVSVVSSSAWKTFFYRELATPLTGQSGNSGSGIPRGASFPHAVVQWDRLSSVISKYGLAQTIAWEDIITDDVDVVGRALFKLAEGVTKYVDDAIYTALTGDSGIQTITATAGWNQTSGALIDDLMQAKQKIAEQNYNASDLMLFVNPRDHRSMIKWLTDKGAQFPSISADAANNGIVGSLVGITIVMSNSVSTSQALVVVPKICGTWRENVPLQTTSKDDDFVSRTIKAVEVGVCQVTDPKAIVVINNTQSA